MELKGSFHLTSKRLILGWTLLGAALLMWAFQAMPQDPKLDTTDPHLLTTAQYLYHFAKDNDWPPSSKTGPFLIGVHDNPGLVKVFADNYGAPPIGDQPLQFLSVQGGGATEGLHIFYTDAKGEDLSKQLKALDAAPTLVMTRDLEALEKGVTVNLMVHDGLLRYELNHPDAENRGLLVGNRIASWAVER